MSKTIPDQAARIQALDPRQSFIVQAPAGSGKTELLTQRFLKLLATVNEPEEILALTFTKKAALEMRSRIRQAFIKAQQAPPEAAHEQQTWQLAQEALKQDELRNWGLLANPNRLRIKTIDSLNTLLTRQLPLLSQFGASPEIMAYPKTLYREAVQTVLTHLEEKVSWSSAIAQLLLQLDNNLLTAEDLLVEMLSKRDHWLPHIMAHQGKSPSLRLALEANLQALIEESLTTLKAALPKESIPDLVSLLQFAAAQLKTINPTSPILGWTSGGELPGTQVRDKESWLALAELLLTKDKTWRKKIDKNIGFPRIQSKSKMDPHRNAKDKMKLLIEDLSQHEKLHQALIDLLYLPEAGYSETQWERLRAQAEVLKIAVAQLQVVFKLSGKIDYTENALAALLALGDEDAPTDLAFVLDYQIKHILVDEFQDTSSNQYELLKKLVRGWQAGDGRSLFLVGDPMQSIYRFREADVGLFLRARQQGLGSIPLKSLTLSVNFRSTPSLITWINTHFNQILPVYDDIASGAVSYTASISGKATATAALSAVQLHAFSNDDPLAQTQGIIRLLQQEQEQQPNNMIAILVRSRNHLKTLIPALKNAKLAYQAVEIDPLQTRPLIQDLLALTRALLYPADRLAWLAILRAPCCGFTLKDLLVLASATKSAYFWQCMQDSELVLQLSSEGQLQLKRILPILTSALAERHREDLFTWVEKTWLALGGPACLETEAELQDANIFFDLLKKLSPEGSLSLKWASLEEALNQLYAQTPSQAACRIQIMTIHNAKGLEFDTVILPHLEKGISKQDKPLLTWLERPLVNNRMALLLAPMAAIGEEEDKLYQHIRRQDKNKTQHEQGRLLYVAATRAKKTLHVCMSLEHEANGEYKLPIESSMLRKMWPTIQHELGSSPPSLDRAPQQEKISYLNRLSSDWTHPLPATAFAERPALNTIQAFHLSLNQAPIIGTVVHYILQQISNFGLSWWNNKSASEYRAYFKALLIKNGSLPTEVEVALEKVEKAIFNTLADQRGQWLLQEWQEAQAEFALTALIKGQATRLVIDRTFVDEKGVRWIIDYKTTVPEDHNLPVFLAKEKEKYASKMQSYHQALASMDPRPIRLGLYFPLVPAWCEWQ